MIDRFDLLTKVKVMNDPLFKTPTGRGLDSIRSIEITDAAVAAKSVRAHILF